MGLAIIAIAGWMLGRLWTAQQGQDEGQIIDTGHGKLRLEIAEQDA